MTPVRWDRCERWIGAGLAVAAAVLLVCVATLLLFATQARAQALPGVFNSAYDATKGPHGRRITTTTPSSVYSFDPAAKGPNLALTVTSHVATAGGGISGFEAVRSIKSHTTGKFCFEVAFSGGSSNSYVVGITSASGPLSAALGSDSNSVGYASGGTSTLKQTNASLGTVPNYATGETVMLCDDIDNQLIWVEPSVAAVWNGGGTANPATGVGGRSYSGLVTPTFAAAGAQASGVTATLNTGDSAFHFTLPSGFTAWAP